MLWFAAAKSAALAYCQLLPDDRAHHSTVRASPWRNSEGRESAGSTTDPIASAWRWRHLEANDVPGTTWRPSRSNGLSTGGGDCAGAALTRTPDIVRALGAGFGRGGRSDASATPRCAWITVRLSSPLATATTATRLGRLGKRGSATARGARRVGYCLLQKPHIRAAIADLKAAILNRAHQRVEDEERAAALAREAELDRLVRLELTAQLEIEEAERELKMLMRMHHEVIAGGRRHRVGSQGGAQSRLARVCRQYRGEPAHREPGRCCCGKLATSSRGASCDYCRERNRHYRRRYRAKVRRLRAV